MHTALSDLGRRLRDGMLDQGIDQRLAVQEAVTELLFEG